MIRMCRNNECENRQFCYRYRSKPRKYHEQEYGEFFTIDGTCEWFWDLREYTNKNIRPLSEIEWDWAYYFDEEFSP